MKKSVDRPTAVPIPGRTPANRVIKKAAAHVRKSFFRAR
jgi:hypothetical protein